VSKGEIGVYRRHRPESTALYEVVRDNIETLFGAIDDGALAVRIPKHARQELLAYLDCGLLCRGFARLKCRGCSETRLVAFSCKGRGFCPSCMGRRMCATAANLIERVLPPSTPLRQWVLTFPFPWRPRLAQDGELLGRLTQIFVDTVQAFYARRAAHEDAMGAKTGAVTAVQRTSSDMRLNPHLHTIALDGAWSEQGNDLVFSGLGHLKTSEVGEVLELAVRRIERHLARQGLLGTSNDDLDLSGEGDPESNLASSAVSGQFPPAGPQWSGGLRPLRPQALAYDKPLCASVDGFTLHAATRAGGLDTEGREALLRYVLRPPIAQERVEQRPDGLVRITLKKAYRDGTVAVDMDPLSLLCRLATSVPLPRFHTIHYAGVLAAASPWRSRLKPSLPPTAEDVEPEKRVRKSGYRPWAELLQRTFSIDVLTCPSCQGRMRLLAVVKNPAGITRYLAAAGELTEVPGRSPPRAPPYWKSQVLRRQALGDQGHGGDHHDTDHEAA
jgi:Putative transposase/Transposase zinc-binding domain